MTEGSAQKPKKPRGFAAMDSARQKEIAGMGGRIAHSKGTAHEYDSVEGRVAGRKGGNSVLKKYGKEHFAAIGRVGGSKRKGKGTPEKSELKTVESGGRTVTFHKGQPVDRQLPPLFGRDDY